MERVALMQKTLGVVVGLLVVGIAASAGAAETDPCGRPVERGLLKGRVAELRLDHA